MSEKKANLLQRYPLVPAVFFILFAWGILHFATPYKPALRAQNIMDNTPTLWQSEDSTNTEWQLKVTERYIYFRENTQAVWQTYLYQRQEIPILILEGTSTTRKSHIKIFLLPSKKGKRHETIIIQEEKHFYGFAKFVKNK